MSFTRGCKAFQASPLITEKEIKSVLLNAWELCCTNCSYKYYITILDNSLMKKLSFKTWSHSRYSHI